MILQRMHKQFHLIKLENMLGKKFEIKQNKKDTLSSYGITFQDDQFEGQHSLETMSLGVSCRLMHMADTNAY